MLILSDRKEYPNARGILKVFLCLRLRNRQCFGECICLHHQIRRGEGEPTLGALWRQLVCVTGHQAGYTPNVHAFLFPPKGGGLVSL